MPSITNRLLLASLLTVLLLGASGCTGSSSSRRTTPSDEVYEDRNDSEVGSDPESGEYEDVEADPEERTKKQRERTLTQRQREHRRSLQNMGSWFLSALIGIGINILLAVLIWG